MYMYHTEFNGRDKVNIECTKALWYNHLLVPKDIHF